MPDVINVAFLSTQNRRIRVNGNLSEWNCICFWVLHYLPWTLFRQQDLYPYVAWQLFLFFFFSFGLIPGHLLSPFISENTFHMIANQKKICHEKTKLKWWIEGTAVSLFSWRVLFGGGIYLCWWLRWDMKMHYHAARHDAIRKCSLFVWKKKKTWKESKH